MDLFYYLVKHMVDAIPECCGYCRYFNHKYQFEPYCELTHSGIGDYLKGRLKNCPLKYIKGVK